MRALPFDVKRPIAEALVGAITEAIDPSPFGPVRHAFAGVVTAAVDARKALWALRRTSREWASAVGPSLASLGVSKTMREQARREPVLAVVVEMRGSGVNVCAVRDMMSMAFTEEDLAAASIGGRPEMRPAGSPGHHVALTLYTLEESTVALMLSKLPVVHHLRLERITRSRPAATLSVPLSSAISTLTLEVVFDIELAAKLVRRCASLNQLDIEGEDMQSIRRIGAAAPVTLRHLVVRGFSGLDSHSPEPGQNADLFVCGRAARLSGTADIVTLFHDIGAQLESLAFAGLAAHIGHSECRERCCRTPCRRVSIVLRPGKRPADCLRQPRVRHLERAVLPRRMRCSLFVSLSPSLSHSSLFHSFAPAALSYAHPSPQQHACRSPRHSPVGL